MIYFDNAATTRVSDAAFRAAEFAMRELYANPSAFYSFGVSAARYLTEAREKLAAVMGVGARELIFTSCATESNNQVIKGIVRANKQKGNRILYSAVEHPSVSNTVSYMKQYENCEAAIIPVNEYGMVRLDALEDLLRQKTLLVCVQWVNNELGIIQPLREIAELTHKYGAFLLVDGVQGFGKLPLKMKDIGADAFSLSGHKIHAPKGVGALWLSPSLRCLDFIQGGGQEQKRRSGTENMPGILALSAAADEAKKNMAANYDKCRKVRDALCEYIKNNIDNYRINTDMENSSPYILNVSFSGTKSEVMLHYLEQKGICVSAGSACSTHKNAQSGKNGILSACSLSDEWTTSCLRFSFCAENTVEEALYTGSVLKEAASEMRFLMK